jgi:hypothetical protein
MDSKLEQAQIIKIFARLTTNGRSSTPQIQFDLSCWSSTSLFRKAILRQADIWKLQIPSAANVTRLRCAITYLSDQSIRALNQELPSLTREDVGTLLQNVDNDFATPSVRSNKTANGYYFAIRRILVLAPGKLKDGLTFEQAAAPYFTLNRRWGRPQIPTPDLPAELGQIDHTDLADLRRQAEKSLQQRKRSIEEAAANEIQTYETNFALQVVLYADQPPTQTAIAINEWITYVKEKDDRPFPPCTPQEFTAVLIRRMRDEPPQLYSTGWPLGLRLPTTKLDWSQVPQAELYRHKTSFWPWFFLQQRLPNAVLTAIFILLLSHTGWNQGSIGSLTVDAITALPQGGYRLQGYKGKTDDHTPVSEVPRYLKAHCKAIDLLLWNYSQLAHLGLIDPKKEKRVWFGWQIDNFATTVNVIGSRRVASFYTRYGLKKFVPSELRPLRAALAYLPQRDLEAVRVLLGHADLTTSNSYLENTLFFRLNEAMMLEFQRRIEATLTYRIGGDNLLIQRSLSARHVDSKLLLVPTGDGGACADIFDGPSLLRRESGEPCAGLACHSGRGCKQYRLIVDEKTLEMAMLSRLYYRARWQKLYETNAIAFTEMHLPKLIYTYVLLRIVREQRPDLYTKAERAVA